MQMNSPDFLWQRGKCTHYAVHLTIVNRNAACLCGTVYVLGCILYLTVSKAPVFLHPYKCTHADDNRKHGSGRGCKPHREQCICEELRGQIRTRYSQTDDRNHIVDESDVGFTVCTEVSAETEMDTG